MKPMFVVLLAIAFISGCSKTVVENLSDYSTISVVGHSETKVDPDTAVINLSIEEVAETSELSRKSVNDVIDKLLNSLTTVQVKNEQVSQSQINQGRKTRWDQGRKVNEGYFSRVQLSIEVSELEKLVSIYDLLAGFNSVQVGNTQFKHSDEQALRAEQAKLALANARKKAKAILRAENKEPGEVLQVVEMGAMPVEPMLKRSGMAEVAMADTSAGAQPDFSQIRLSASVNASFLIQ